MSDFGRWLSPEQLASYIGERVDRLPRLRRAGKLPPPSVHLGPRSPRYDREAVDALFAGGAASSVGQLAQDAVNAIIKRARDKARFGGRNRAGIPLPARAGRQT